MNLINFIKRTSHFRLIKKVFSLSKSDMRSMAGMECIACFINPVEPTVEDFLERCATEEEGDEQFNRTYDLVKRLSALRKIEEMQSKALSKGERLKAEQEELIQRLIKCQ